MQISTHLHMHIYCKTILCIKKHQSICRTFFSFLNWDMNVCMNILHFFCLIYLHPNVHLFDVLICAFCLSLYWSLFMCVCFVCFGYRNIIPVCVSTQNLMNDLMWTEFNGVIWINKQQIYLLALFCHLKHTSKDSKTALFILQAHWSLRGMCGFLSVGALWWGCLVSCPQ